MIGLAKKAGKIISGTNQVMCGIRAKQASYILFASDISENTRQRLVNCCSHYEMEYADSGLSMDELSHFVGKKSYASSVAVTDQNFTAAIKKILKDADAVSENTAVSLSEVTICH